MVSGAPASVGDESKPLNKELRDHFELKGFKARDIEIMLDIMAHECIDNLSDLTMLIEIGWQPKLSPRFGEMTQLGQYTTVQMVSAVVQKKAEKERLALVHEAEERGRKAASASAAIIAAAAKDDGRATCMIKA